MRLVIPVLFLAAGCAQSDAGVGPKTGACDVPAIREKINDARQRGVEATRNEDIDLYMDGIPDDFRVEEDDGTVNTKEQLRQYALRNWAVIDRTLELSVTITSLNINSNCNEAQVFTDQRWERIMQRPDNSGTDVILTTQKHEEEWRLVENNWFNYNIKELGGEVFVNGEPY